MEIITCKGPVNIATIKYWGKRDEHLILPLNDSISVTLSTEQLCAKTTVMVSPTFVSDKMWLNGKEQSVDTPRFSQLMKAIRKRAQIKSNDAATLKVHICSENNFPTAAGLASSAAGYACLVYALSYVYNVSGDISSIARMGSGSACRSIYGGFVQWHAGEKSDGSDSVAEQLFPADHWPELRIIILVVSENQKKVGSTSGMQQSVHTSTLLKYRVEESVPRNIERMKKAIKAKNFAEFAEVTIQDSNQMHATCLDTYPPIVYMNDKSHYIIDFVHTYNRINEEIKVAYTCDAGANVCLFVLEKDVNRLMTVIEQTFPAPSGTEDYVRGIPYTNEGLTGDELPYSGIHHEPGMLKYIIITKVGEGPTVLKDQNQHLLDSYGKPKSININTSSLI